MEFSEIFSPHICPFQCNQGGDVNRARFGGRNEDEEEKNEKNSELLKIAGGKEAAKREAAPSSFFNSTQNCHKWRKRFRHVSYRMQSS